MAKMDERKLKAILKSELEGGIGVNTGALGGQRAQAIDYYYGKPFGNEQDGRSQIVLSDVQDTIEWALPQLLKPFVAGRETGRFEPHGPEDEEAARQATDYVNFILNHDNNRFLLLYQWFKDALLEKNGFVKAYWETKTKVETETYSGLSDDEAAAILQNYGEDGEIDVLEHDQDVDDRGQTTHDIKLTRTAKHSYVCVENVPPEDIIVSKKATSDWKVPFIAHVHDLTRSELIEMGYSREKVKKLASSMGGGLLNQEFTARHDIDEDTFGSESAIMDESRETIRVAECYSKIDWNGDGISEWRKVMYVQDDDEILDNVPIDDEPFVTMTPIIMPHKYFGRSMADLTMDIQLIRSTLLRQVLDNMYGMNNNRYFIDTNRVEVDDLLTNRPDAAIRVDGPVGDAVRTFPISPLGPYAFPVLEWMNQEKESRSGVNRYIQGLDPGSLNKTFGGMSLMTNAAAQRLELIARVFAEASVAKLYAKILKIVTRHQDKPRMIRLRNSFVEMDPRTWNSEMDVTIEVGIGYGSKEMQNAMLDQFLAYQFQIVQVQGGVDGPLVTLPNVYATLDKKAEAAGLKTASPYFTDPAAPEAQAAKQAMANRPSPEMAKVQMEQQSAQAKLQMEQAKQGAQMQLDQQKAQADVQLSLAKIQTDGQIALKKMEGELALKREAMLMEHGLKAEEAALGVISEQAAAEAKLGMEREKTAGELAIKREQGQGDLSIQRDKMNGEQRIRTAETLMSRPEKEGADGMVEPVKTPLDDLIEAMNRQAQTADKTLQAILKIVSEQAEATEAISAAVMAPKMISKTAGGDYIVKPKLN